MGFKYTVEYFYARMEATPLCERSCDTQSGAPIRYFPLTLKVQNSSPYKPVVSASLPTCPLTVLARLTTRENYMSSASFPFGENPSCSDASAAVHLCKLLVKMFPAVSFRLTLSFLSPNNHRPGISTSTDFQPLSCKLSSHCHEISSFIKNPFLEIRNDIFNLILLIRVTNCASPCQFASRFMNSSRYHA